MTHPARFDPETSADTLMESEHRGRYSWAAQAVSGLSVLDAGCGTGYGLAILAQGGAAALTGIDIDSAAVAEAERRAGGDGVTVAQADLQALELPDDSFDVAVCFETIEHLASPEQGLAELRRVVRPGGMIFVSSPNPDVYPSGNEHHLRELRPDELRSLVDDHFASTHTYVQHPWLASVIEPANGNGSSEGHDNAQNGIGVRRAKRLGPDQTTFTIVIGCDGEQPEPSPLISLGDDFEVRWWEEQVSAARRGAEERQELGAERGLQEALAREAQLSERLRKTSAALIDANQALAEVPVLKHRLAEMYDRKAGLEAQLDQVLGSRSWQATGFLRRLGALLKLQR